ncbi:hypothetical protein SELMODRAFT_405471 [Selaginella moellendorffii]|uniref:Uncharacterized protein n=1 Tax=Selaginella moellendorffii TaxID=88036 RepID=D8QYP2_SELML|nr:hypothetical protein SELMODRAFT_405471 [Selaginella moellendorffii]
MGFSVPSEVMALSKRATTMDKQGVVESAAAQSPSFLELLKSWFLCGWLADKAALLKTHGPSYIAVGSRSQSASSSLDPQSGASGPKPYMRPSRWTQLVRKCRARFRRGWIHDGNPQGGQFDPHQQHYYKMDSYERNFDRGREFWEDLALIGQPLEENSPRRWAIPEASVPDPGITLEMRARVRSASLAAFKRRREESFHRTELWPGQREFLQAERERKKRLGILTRKVRPFAAANQCPRRRAQPSVATENATGTHVAFVRAAPPIPTMNSPLLRQLESRRESDTFVLDTSVACLFKDLRLEPSQVTADRERFLELLKGAKLAAPPVAWKEYALFGLSSAIPFSTMSEKRLEDANRVVDSLIGLFRRAPKGKWLAMKESHKSRVKDYLFVVQSAMLYPKTTILTNDSDFGIFEVMAGDIEQLLYRRHNSLSLSLSSVSIFNVAYDLGLDLRCSRRKGKFLFPQGSRGSRGSN